MKKLIVVMIIFVVITFFVIENKKESSKDEVTLSYNLKDENVFFKLVRDSFVQKRKTLRNNLKAYDLNIIETVLNKYGYDLSVRAENLSIDIFVDIANNL